MNIDDLVVMLVEHRWVPACALLIGAIVRLLKSDTPLPFTVPARARPWLAVGLGILAGSLEAIAGGTPWARALAEGLAAALLAITGHELGVESLRAGKEPFARRGDDEPPRGIEQATRITGAMVLLFYAGVFVIGACQHERPACSPARLATIEAAYVDEVLAACHGQAFDTCSARPEIEAHYALQREEWARCR